MKPHPALLIVVAASALACSNRRTSESTGEVVPRADTMSVPADTITTRTRDDTLNLQRDTAAVRDTSMIYRDTTTGIYGDTTRRSVRDTATTQPRDTSALPPDTSVQRR
jgi:hypothetical protein